MEIFLKFTTATGHPHPQVVLGNYGSLLKKLGRSDAEVQRELTDLRAKYGIAAD